MSRFARRACEECRKDYVPRSRTQRFCLGCATVERTCVACGGTFTVRRTELSKRPVATCSTACRRQFGGLHYSKSQGRWFVICRDQTKYLFSRAVMAGVLGRALRDDEHVHHRNEDKADDDPSNLRILTPSEHGRLHNPPGRKIGAPR